MSAKEFSIEQFRQLDDSLKDRLAEIDSPLQASLAILVVAKDHFDIESLSLVEIAGALEDAGVSFKLSQLHGAFARAGNRIGRTKVGETIKYRVMTAGRKEVEPLLAVGNVEIVYIKEGHPRTARQRLEEVLGSLSGTIRISDPYYGVRTLDTLALIPSPCKVLFLTENTSEKSHQLAGPLADFKRERPSTEIRLISTSKILHDRYILTDDSLLLVGQGIKDIGNKESFIIIMGRSVAADLMDQLKASFDARWATAGPL